MSPMMTFLLVMFIMIGGTIGMIALVVYLAKKSADNNKKSKIIIATKWTKP